MNTLKPLLIFAVLIGVCYGVYSRINHKPSAPPPEAMVNWETTQPDVQMPEGAAGSGDNRSPGPLGNSFMGGGIPSGSPLGRWAAVWRRQLSPLRQPSPWAPAAPPPMPTAARWSGDPQAGGWAPPVENGGSRAVRGAALAGSNPGGPGQVNAYDNAYGPPPTLRPDRV